MQKPNRNYAETKQMVGSIMELSEKELELKRAMGRKYTRTYREKHKEKSQAYQRKWREENQDKIKEYRRAELERRKLNREKGKIYE